MTVHGKVSVGKVYLAIIRVCAAGRQLFLPPDDPFAPLGCHEPFNGASGYMAEDVLADVTGAGITCR